MSEAIREAMRERFCAPRWALCFEVQDATGMRATRSADAIAMSLWPSLGLELWGFEFKVSRSDWLRELKDPSKAETFKRFCDRWVLVTLTTDVAKPHEIPDGWGWIVVRGAKLHTIKAAPVLQAQQITRPFLAALLRRADKALGDVGAAAAQENQPEVSPCTGWEAVWCPLHGDCCCPCVDGRRVYNARGCPLHADWSDHGDPHEGGTA